MRARALAAAVVAVGAVLIITAATAADLRPTVKVWPEAPG
jgi:hypothetical protein